MKDQGFKIIKLVFFALSIVIILSFSSHAEAQTVPVSAATNYDQFGATPNHACSRLNDGEWAPTALQLGSPGNKCTLYNFLGLSSISENLICSMADNPSDTTLIKSASWEFESDFSSPLQIQLGFGSSNPFTATWLAVCQDGSYTFVGPITINQDSPCECRAEPGPTEPCIADSTTMCLNNDRFRVKVSWRSQDGQTGVGHAVPYTNDSGMFWFFNNSNLELLIKVLNGCGNNNHYWVFFAATTDQEFTVTVTDTLTGQVNQYKNPMKHPADAVTDTSAFATCP